MRLSINLRGLVPNIQEMPVEARSFLISGRVNKALHWLAGGVLLATLLDRTPISDIPTLRTVAGAFGVILAFIWVAHRVRTFRLRQGPFFLLISLIAAIVYVDVLRFISIGAFAAASFMQWFQALIFALILMDIARDYRAIPVLAGCTGFAILIVAIMGTFGAEVGQGRIGAEVFNLNAQAFYLALLSIGLMVFVLKRWPVMNLSVFLALACICLTLFVTVRTGSRTGLVALFAGLAVVSTLMLRQRNLSAYVTLIPGAVAIAVFVLASSGAIGRWERLFSGEDFGYRDVIWTAALEMFYDSPFLGHGADFVNSLGEMTRDRDTTSHNQYLMLLLAYGLMGLFLWLGIVFSCLRRCWKLRRHPAAVALIGMIICSLIFGIGGDLTFKRYFWVVIAVAANIDTLVLAYPHFADRAKSHFDRDAVRVWVPKQRFR